MEQSTSRRDIHNERGAVLAMGAAAIFAVLVVAALVVDIGLARSDLAQNRLAADNIATAGAVGIAEGGGIMGCETAVGYVAENIGTVSGLSCAGFPASCNATTPVSLTSGSGEGVAVTIYYPVNDTHHLMTPASRGAQTVSAADGSQCDRLGVKIHQERSALFAQTMGTDTLATSVHSVARVGEPTGPGDIINLLVLEPHRCPALKVNGGGSGGGITVDAVVDPLTGEIHPGRIALDSDGTVGCGSTIETTGSHANIHANGAPGCAGEVSPGTGAGCGEIETYATGAPGCNPPACSGASGTVAPAPGQTTRRRTRAPFDWRFNCKPSYPASYGIAGCPNSGSTGPYLDDLVLGTTFATGYTYYSDHFDCSVKPSDVFLVPEGNWLIDCDPLSVKGVLDFAGGNLIVEEDINLGSSGILRVNNNNTDLNYSWVPGTAVDATEYSDGAALIVFRDGKLSKSGGATLNFQNTMVYLSETSRLDMTGGGGAGPMIWTAPTEGPFKDLALWSESPDEHKFAGSASLALEGVVFAPHAEISFQGNGGITSVEAQFIAKSVSTGGNGSLHIAPILGRSVAHPDIGDSELIR